MFPSPFLSRLSLGSMRIEYPELCTCLHHKPTSWFNTCNPHGRPRGGVVVYACAMCLRYVPALYACSICLLYVPALCACSICLLYMPALHACSMCLLYMPALCACSMCLLYVPALYAFHILSPVPPICCHISPLCLEGF
jgi:hypothetical protein